MEPPSSDLYLVWFAAALVALVPLLTVATALLERAGPIRLRSWLESVGPSLERLGRDRRWFEGFRFLVNLSAKGVGLAAVAVLVAGLPGAAPAREPVAWLVLVLLWVSSSELFARYLLAADAEAALEKWTWLLRGLYLGFRPVIPLVARWMPDPAEREDAQSVLPDQEVTEEEVEAFLDVGTREGILEPEERELVWGIVDFGDKPVRSVMTPRIDMVACSVGATLESLSDQFVRSAHTRIPVYRNTIDEIVGIVHVRDLLVGLRAATPPTVEELAHPALLIPETRLLKDVLRDLRARRQQIAIVINEWGGTEGLVTIQDLLEQIVGEIPDEHGPAKAGEKQLEDGSYLLEGRADLEDLAERFGFRPEQRDPSISTLGGWLTQHQGRVPETGEVVEESGFRFEVLRSDGRRVTSVRLTPLVREAGNGAGK